MKVKNLDVVGYGLLPVAGYFVFKWFSENSGEKVEILGPAEEKEVNENLNKGLPVSSNMINATSLINSAGYLAKPDRTDHAPKSIAIPGGLEGVQASSAIYDFYTGEQESSFESELLDSAPVKKARKAKKVFSGGKEFVNDLAEKTTVKVKTTYDEVGF